MIRLIRADLYLIFRQKQTYYGLAAILIIELFIVAAAWFQGNEIIDILLDNLAKNFFIEGNLVNGNLVMYIVLNSLWFNLPLIIMIIVSGFLTNEYKDRTIQTVMLQSVKKLDYITAKYTAGMAFTLFVILFLFLTASALAYGLFGQGDLITYLNSLNFIGSDEALARIVWSFAIGAVLLVFYSIASITFAVIFREITVTWIACALFLILCNLLLKMDLGVLNSWFLPKLIDGWQYFFYFEIPWSKVLINQLFMLGYITLFMTVGVGAFIKKDIG
jgi:ABC-2 type transport system permease protein